MRSLEIRRGAGLNGVIQLPGDKSIAHRSIVIAAISAGKTKIVNFPANKDCLATLNSFQKLGVRITKEPLKRAIVKSLEITIFGKGLYGLKKPRLPIFVEDSGTTLRLNLGVLAGQNFTTKLVAGKSLSLRPMLRVTYPLRMMGAAISAKRTMQGAQREEYPPLIIKGGRLKAITYKMQVASAQVKSAILLAGLYADGLTKVSEPMKTRDHTERMLKLFGAGIKPLGNTILIKGKQELRSPGKIFVPGDISSASFFMVAACLIPHSKITIKKVSLNPSRLGVLNVLKRMGADIKVIKAKAAHTKCEPFGNIIIRNSSLRGTTIKRDEIPLLIDELPILMVAACFAKGRTICEGVQELRVKETDRIRSMTDNLNKMGADICVQSGRKAERVIIKGVGRLKACAVKSYGDHRTAMSMVVAGLVAEGTTIIDDIDCINKSFPEFLRILTYLTK